MMSRVLIICAHLLIMPALQAADALHNQWGMKFVKIPAGEFQMGLHDRDEALMEVPDATPSSLLDELPRHSVTLSQPFYMGVTEVTQQQWLSIMENRPGPAANWRRDDWQQLPVVSVSWFMVERFLQEINRLDTAYRYRLPTEAEWEYVAWGGASKDDLRPVSIDQLAEYAWFIENSLDKPQPVGGLMANPYGVHDILGNVWEWVADWYAADTYSKSVRTDPTGPSDGVSRVRRGGSYHCPLHLLRPGYRSANRPEVRYEVVGFRLVSEKR